MKPQDQPQGLTLLQFATDDPLANLMPIMGLRPARIMHLGSGLDAVRTMVQAVAQTPDFKGWQPKVVEVNPPKAVPDIADVREFIATTLLANPGMVINFSGGGKLTSIGAFQAAQVLGRPTLMCDPAHQRFVDGQTGRFAKWPDYREVEKRLSMRVLMAAQGKNFSDWRSEQATDALRAYGLKAFELRNNHWGALDGFNKALRAHLYPQGDKLPANPEDLRTLLAKPLPPQLTSTEPGRQLLAAAVPAGLVRAEGQTYKLIAQLEKRSIDRVVQLLSNSWIELAVLDCLMRNPRYTEPHWNFEPANQQNTEYGDLDIFCLDQQGMTLRLISCKSVIDRAPQEHLDRMVARAARVGAKASTFVLFKPAQSQESSIRSYAKRLGIDVAMEADEIVKAFSPSVK